MRVKTKRLDNLLVEKGFVESRKRALALVMAGKVSVGDMLVTKAGKQVREDAVIRVACNDHPYVSRGGLKLEKALLHSGILVDGLIGMDAGASTGGFTDCLLQHGAKRVYSVDVGYGQISWKLRNDSRVALIERRNIRYLDHELVPEPIDIVVIDCSFISLKKVLPPCIAFLRPNAYVVGLIKPQFEVGPENVGKGGVVRDRLLQEEVVVDMKGFFETQGICDIDVIESPILGTKGNREFLIIGRFNLPFKKSSV